MPPEQSNQSLRAEILAIPILYTDVLQDGTDKAKQVCRDDLWAVTTADLNYLWDKSVFLSN